MRLPPGSVVVRPHEARARAGGLVWLLRGPGYRCGGLYVCVSVCRCVAVDRGRCATLTTALPAPVPSGPPRELDIYLILIFLCVAD